MDEKKITAIAELGRLKAIEQKCKDRLENRVDDRCGGSFCAFCFGSYEHTIDCVYHLINKVDADPVEMAHSNADLEDKFEALLK